MSVGAVNPSHHIQFALGASHVQPNLTADRGLKLHSPNSLQISDNVLYAFVIRIQTKVGGVGVLHCF